MPLPALARTTRSAGLLGDPASQSEYCQQQGGSSGSSRLALCIDTHSGGGCAASGEALGDSAAIGRRQYIGVWHG